MKRQSHVWLPHNADSPGIKTPSQPIKERQFHLWVDLRLQVVQESRHQSTNQERTITSVWSPQIAGCPGITIPVHQSGNNNHICVVTPDCMLSRNQDTSQPIGKGQSQLYGHPRLHSVQASRDQVNQSGKDNHICVITPHCGLYKLPETYPTNHGSSHICASSFIRVSLGCTIISSWSINQIVPFPH